MGPQEFRRLVKNDAGSLDPRAVEAATEYYIARKRLERQDVENCVSYAQGLAANRSSSGSKVALTPSMIVASDQLAEAIRPEVERVREGIFRGRAAPFRSLGDAAAWIEETKKAQRRPSASDRKRAKAIEAEIVSRVRDLQRLLKSPVGFEYRPSSLAYVKPGQDWVCNVPAMLGSPLASLAAVASEVSRTTGLQEAAVTAFILAGVPPLLPPARVSTEQVFPGRKAVIALPISRATIHLFTRDLSFQELHGIYRELRAALGIERSKRISARHQILVETVRKLGGAPRRGKRAWGQVTEFWEKVRVQVNQKYPKAAFSSWRAVKMAHHRLSEKLSV